jgi:hypothetical protein
MSMGERLDIPVVLDMIGDSVLKAISYSFIPLDTIDSVILSIDVILSDAAYLKECEVFFKSQKRNEVLFYLSNIIYNLKTKSELRLSPDVLKWLGSVWKNFIRRNRSYQEAHVQYLEYCERFRKLYPGDSVVIRKIDNVHLVKDEYIDENDPEYTELRRLEKFSQGMMELLSWMKPTYFVLLDYYYERNMKTGVSLSEGEQLEKQGLPSFGHPEYTYLDISIATCQSLGILEAVYLYLKKRRTSRQIITVDGKTKFLTVSEIYELYRDRFVQMKEEIVRMTQRG